MVSGAKSGCINHPAVEAVDRCKQCGKPFCDACRVKGPTGNFCSEACQGGHEQFTQRAQQLDNMGRGGGFTVKIYWLLKKLLIFAIVAALVGVGAHFMGMNVPIISDLLR